MRVRLTRPFQPPLCGGGSESTLIRALKRPATINRRSATEEPHQTTFTLPPRVARDSSPPEGGTTNARHRRRLARVCSPCFSRTLHSGYGSVMGDRPAIRHFAFSQVLMRGSITINTSFRISIPSKLLRHGARWPTNHGWESGSSRGFAATSPGQMGRISKDSWNRCPANGPEIRFRHSLNVGPLRILPR